jgi:mono/diheme cytochrome c family protein
MRRRSRLALLAAAALLPVLAAPASAQQTVKREPIKPITDVSGAATYNAYCTVCHGPDAKGNGPAASALVKPPADLTRITQRHDGKFPSGAVRMAIIGDNAIPAHGTPDMPMWGPLFRSVEGDLTAQLRLRNLVLYLETLQAK